LILTQALKKQTTQHNEMVSNKSSAITLQKLDKFLSETPGAQLHILSNIPVRFHDSMSNPFWVTWDTSWKLQNLLSQGQ
jgi:hypothetical protein